MERYDALVVGAGIGGMTAAAILAREGMRVLVLERGNRTGGLANAYDIDGFSFPTGPLGFSFTEIIGELLDDLGVGEGLEFRRVNYKLKALGIEVLLSMPFPELARELAAAFSADKKKLERFFSELEGIASSLRASPPASDLIINEPSGQYIGRVTSDWRLRRVIGGMGAHEPTMGIPMLASMWDLMCNKGIHYPVGGFPLLSKRFKTAVENSRRGAGGAIRLGSEVGEITIDGGAVCGVKSKDGVFYEAPAVISNVDFKATFLSLVNGEHVPPEWQAAVGNARESSSTFQVSLGVDTKNTDLSIFNGASRLIYRSAGDDGEQEVNWGAPEIDPDKLAAQELEISLWSAEDPGLAPDGKEVIVIRVGADHDHFAGFRPSTGERDSRYADYKSRLGRALIEECAKVVPGLIDAIEVIDISTPLTFEEEGGRRGGAAAGWSWEYSETDDPSPRELVLTPIKGLYMAGYQAMSWLLYGGLATAALTGRRAARAVLGSEGPVREVTIPGL